MEKVYILVVKYYNEYDYVNHQETWRFKSMKEAKQKEKELIEQSDKKIETTINTFN